MRAAVVALDGQPVAVPQETDSLSLVPAQRVDLIADITADEGDEGLILSRERDGAFAIVSLPVEEGAAPREDDVTALPANDVPLPTQAALQDAPLVPLRMEGGAMRGMASARLNGEELDARELALRGMVWALNGEAGMPDAPLVEVSRGEVVRIEMINDTAWPHGMHLHGHHFVTVRNGQIGPLRDTLAVGRDAREEIAFVADNPGDWLVHCHMLEHAHAGMMTWIRVT